MLRMWLGGEAVLLAMLSLPGGGGGGGGSCSMAEEGEDFSPAATAMEGPEEEARVSIWWCMLST